MDVCEQSAQFMSQKYQTQTWNRIIGYRRQIESCTCTGHKMHAHAGLLQHRVRISPQIDRNLEIGIRSELVWNKSEKQYAMRPAEGALGH